MTVKFTCVIADVINGTLTPTHNAVLYFYEKDYNKIPDFDEYSFDIIEDFKKYLFNLHPIQYIRCEEIHYLKCKNISVKSNIDFKGLIARIDKYIKEEERS